MSVQCGELNSKRLCLIGADMTVSRLDMVLCVCLFFLFLPDYVWMALSLVLYVRISAYFSRARTSFRSSQFLLLSRPGCTQLRFNEHVYNVRYAVFGIHAGEL